MQSRLAKKIVARVLAGEARPTSYPITQVEDAFRMIGKPLTTDLRQPWDAREKKVQEDPVLLAQRQERNRQRREHTLAHLEAQRQARQQKMSDAKARNAVLQAMRSGVIVEHIQGATSSVEPNVPNVVVTQPEVESSPQEKAVAVAKEVFEQTMQAGEVPESVAIQPQDSEALDYASMTVPELRAMAKGQGLKGYSGLSKTDLIALLSGHSPE